MKKALKSKLAAIIGRANDASTEMSAKFVATMSNKSGAALWEYLLVIVIVCVLGAGLINVISGPDNGIAALWKQLYAKFTALVNIGVGAT